MKLAILEPLGVDKAKLLAMAKDALGDRVEIVAYDDRKEDVPTLIERSKDADIVVLSNFQYREPVISQCPNLKMICVAFTGFDHIDMEYCAKRGITVCNCAGYSNVAVAELVICMVISLLRKVRECDIAAHAGGTKAGLTGYELEGKKFGILINCARGPVVDSQALADALNNGDIAAAGIDVLEGEPPFDTQHPLVTAKNVLLTPHTAFATAESMVKRAVIVFDNIAAYLDGKPQNVVK